MTTTVPPIRLNGKVRRGFFTSPAANVTLFHASEENKGPTIAPPSTIKKPSDKFCSPQKWVTFAVTASALRDTNNPSRIRASNAATFAEVKTFWTSFPSRTPRLFDQVNNAITAMAITRCVENETEPTCNSRCSADTQG